MMLPFIIVACELLVLVTSLALPSSSVHRSHRLESHLLPNRVIAQFPVGTWIENIAVRSNGKFLLTSFLPDATLYEVSDLNRQSPVVTRLFTIDTVTCFLGITETSKDVFAVAGGNFSQSTGGVKGTYGLWRADFTHGSPSCPKLIASIPDTILLNGATTVPRKMHLVLLADSILNVIWRVDVKKGTVDKAVQFPPQRTALSQAVTIGINGIHIHDGYLWFTNDTATVSPATGDLETSMYRIKIDENGGAAHNVLAKKALTLPSGAMDDFIYGPRGRDIKWVATNQFGRTKRDSHILYVSTGGGTINGTTEGGKVQAIDTTGFNF